MIHREGIVSLSLSIFLFGLVSFLCYKFLPSVFPFVLLVFSILFFLLVWFFRNPKRTIPKMDDSIVYSPADGKVVAIEKVNEGEYFRAERIQVSVFMSPLNVHVNRNPIGGKISYTKYHEGKYLAAWNPKSSTENERSTTVIESGGKEVLFRQIAGALARRIVNYVNPGDRVIQGEDMGFIKLGSRVDIFLPLDAEVLVKQGDKVQGAIDAIARI